MPGSFTAYTDGVTVIAATDLNNVRDTLSDVPVFAVPWKTQRYYSTHSILGGINATTTTLTAFRAYAHLIVAPSDTPIDQVAIEVLALVNPSTIRLGLYAAGSDGWPGALIADWGDVDSSTNGVKTISISTTLSGGTPYYVVAAPSAAVGVRTHVTILSPFGQPTAGGANAHLSVLFRNDTTTGMDDPFGTPTNGTNTSMIYLRAT